MAASRFESGCRRACGYKPNGKAPVSKTGSSPYGVSRSESWYPRFAAVAERVMVPVLKTGGPKGSGSSNLSGCVCIRAGGQHPVSKTGNDGPTPSGCAENSVCAWGISVSELCYSISRTAKKRRLLCTQSHISTRIFKLQNHYPIRALFSFQNERWRH